jgi:hypothetical protein
MALYHKWDVKNDFAYVLQFFSLISDGLGSVPNAPYSWITALQIYCGHIVGIVINTTLVYAFQKKNTSCLIA